MLISGTTRSCTLHFKVYETTRAQKLYRSHGIANNAMLHTLINKNNLRGLSMIRCLAYAFKAIFKSRAKLVAENLCLRQQLIVLKRRQARPQLQDADRRFWVLACQWFSGRRASLIVVRPDTVVN